MNNLPGPGDEATWGPVTSSSDPRSQSWLFQFYTTIGIGNAEVYVELEFYNDEPSGMLYGVWFEGLDITSTITDETERLIRKHAAAAHEQNKRDQMDYDEDYNY